MRKLFATLENLPAIAVVVAKRLRHHLGLSVSALVGIISVLSLVICVPVFTNAVLSRVLQQTLTEKSVRNHRSLFSLHVYYRADSPSSAVTAQNADAITGWINQQVTQQMGLPLAQTLTQIATETIVFRPVKYQSSQPPFGALHLSLLHTNLAPEKTTLVEGAWPTTAEAAATATGPVPVAVEEGYADEHFLNVGDVLQADQLAIEIVGVFRAVDPNDLSWFYRPATTFNDTAWVPRDYFAGRLSAGGERPVQYASWYAVVADGGLRFNNSLDYTRSLIRLQTDLQAVLPKAAMDYSPLEELKAYDARRLSLTVLFYAAGAPLVLLALIFIGLTASIALQQQEQETATLRGRGVTLRQVLGLNVAESVVLIGLALPAALGVGWLAALAMGHTTLFLQFNRASDLDFSLADINPVWLGGVMAVILLARCLPLLGLRRTTAVSLKQERSRSARRPVWERFFLDFLLLIPAGYAYWVLRNQLLQPAEAAAPGASGGQGQYDPLMFAASSLFAIAACMLVLRVFPLIVRLLARLSERFFATGPYLAVQELARRPQEHASVMLLIMISLSLAIYSASMAKTLDRWMHASRYYQAGADLVLRIYELPVAPDANPLAGGAAGQPAPPDITQGAQSLVNLQTLLAVDGIRSATTVGEYFAQVTPYAGASEINLVGIDRLSFPGTAYFRADFSDQSLGALMNALAAVPNGVLVEPAYLESTGLRVGDLIQVSSSFRMLNQGFKEQMIIVGTFTYFPTVYPSKTPTMIANLGELFGTPEAAVDYDVWLAIQDGADVRSVVRDLQALAYQNGQALDIRQNALLDIQTLMGQPEWVGLFGLLSVGFLLTGLMPCIGFVLDTFAALRKHFIQLGILMAVGLPQAQVVSYLVLERLFLMGMALAGGAGVGFSLCVLFIPLLQISTAGAAPVPPFEVLIGWAESTWLVVAFGVVLLIVVIGTIGYLVQLKIFQAVKLGESL
ncbi:MAG: ABC transporter permease [Anaerolineales bacterium]|nr:ABC transporter permease [Anaerolineales bacterium]